MDGQQFLEEFLKNGASKGIAQDDAYETGFATLTDKEGHPYVAHLDSGTKEGKGKKEESKKEPESKKTEEKKKPEAEKKGAEVVELHPELRKPEKKTGIFSGLFRKGNFDDVLIDLYKQENITTGMSDNEIAESISKTAVNSPVFIDRKKKAEELMNKVKNESWYDEFSRDFGGNFAKLARNYIGEHPSEKNAAELTSKIDNQINEVERYLKDPKKYNADGKNVQNELKDIGEKLREKRDQIARLPRSRENTTAYNKVSKALHAISNGTEFDVRPVTSELRMRQQGINSSVVEAVSDLSGLEKIRDTSKKLLSTVSKKYPSENMAQDSSLDTFLKNISVEER